jgi:hypothetical protein
MGDDGVRLVKIRTGLNAYVWLNPEQVTYVMDHGTEVSIHLISGEMIKCYYGMDSVAEDLRLGRNES